MQPIIVPNLDVNFHCSICSEMGCSITPKYPVHVKVRTSWPDYVFDKKYKLMSLDELNKYIKANNHLPDMPTAGDVEKGGVNVSEMITKLLKTQEEQAQYILLLNEQNKKLQKEIEELKTKK